MRRLISARPEAHDVRRDQRARGPVRTATAATTATVVGAGLALGLALTGTPATAATGARPTTSPDAERVLVQGLQVPFGLSTARGNGLLVAQNAAGEVTRIDRRGRTRAVVRGVPGVTGVASRGRWVWSLIGGTSPDGPPAGGAYGEAKLLRTDLDTGRTRVIADLLAHELKNNPDGQVQLVDGQPVDALSNPFSMAWSSRGLLVADGGANDVLLVNPRTGRTRTFFVPPNPRTPACLADDAQSNPGTVGCDSVPTGVAVRGGSVFVSTLGSERPGAGRIYKLSLRTGKVQRTWRGLDSPTGVAVGRRAVYYSQVFGNGSGAVVRVARRGGGTRTAAVPQPTALLFARGVLHASANSLTPGQGRVVTLPERRFR